MEKKLKGFGSDRLTDLPENVLNSILAWLPLKDAVRTCTLSSKWKDKWHTLPQILFNQNEFTDRQKVEIEGILHCVLNQHEGNIQKFRLSVLRVKGYNLKSWVRSLSRKGIQDLTLKIWTKRYHLVPSDLFSCQQLRQLKLRHFVFKMPVTFRGFFHLFSLTLKDISVDSRMIENFIASCPLLEHLVVAKVKFVHHLRINLPNLKYFIFSGNLESLHLSTPRLAVMSLKWIPLDYLLLDQSFEFSGLPLSIEVLHMRCPLDKFLNAVNSSMEDSTYSSLRTLEVDGFCFRGVDEVSNVLSLIKRFPNIQTLDIGGCIWGRRIIKHDEIAVKKFWEEEKTWAHSLNHLQTFKVRSFHGTHPVLRFIRFVMANSPVLKEMIIHDDYKEIDKTLAAQMMSFPRASREIDVKFRKSNADKNSDDDASSDYVSDDSSHRSDNSESD